MSKKSDPKKNSKPPKSDKDGNPFEPPKKKKQSNPKSKETDKPPKSRNWLLIVAIVLGILIFIVFLYNTFSSGSIGDYFSKDSCNYNGLTYLLDETFESKDGCNVCSCVEGKVECTELSCTEPEDPVDREELDTSEVPVYDPSNTNQYLNASLDCSQVDEEMYISIQTSLPNGVHVELEDEYSNEAECTFEFTYLNSVMHLGEGVGVYSPLELSSESLYEGVPTGTSPSLVRLSMASEPSYTEESCVFFGVDSQGECDWYKYGNLTVAGDENLFYTGIVASGDGQYGIADVVISSSDSERMEEILEVFDYVVENTTLE